MSTHGWLPSSCRPTALQGRFGKSLEDMADEVSSLITHTPSPPQKRGSVSPGQAPADNLILTPGDEK